MIGQFLEMVDTASGIVGSTTGSNYYVRILSTLNRELLKPSASVALHRHSNALVDILPPEADSSISLLSQSERPDVTYQARTCLVMPGSLLVCCRPFRRNSSSCSLFGPPSCMGLPRPSLSALACLYRSGRLLQLCLRAPPLLRCSALILD